MPPNLHLPDAPPTLKRCRRKGLIAAAAALAVLVAVRAILPIWLESAINAELGRRDLGEVGEVDLTLSRLNVELKDVQLVHVSPKGLTTLTKISSIELNFHWDRLLSGHAVANVNVDEPQVTLRHDPVDVGPAKPRGSFPDLPFNIDRLSLRRGTFVFEGTTLPPGMRIVIEDIQLNYETGTSTHESADARPSYALALNGVFAGGGDVIVQASRNAQAEHQPLEATAEIRNLPLRTLNPILERGLRVNADEGSVQFMTQLFVRGGQYSGYFKPVVEEAHLISLDGNSFRETLAGTLDKVRSIVENKESDTPEGVVPFEGEVSEFDAEAWKTLRGLLSNAFLRTLLEARVSP